MKKQLIIVWGLQLCIDYESLLTSPTHQLTLNEAKDKALTCPQINTVKLESHDRLVSVKGYIAKLGLSVIQNSILEGERQLNANTQTVFKETATLICLSVSVTHEIHVWVSS